VVSVLHGREPASLTVEVRSREKEDRGRLYRLEADHVILALPQHPLRRLSEHFPSDVQKDLELVVGFPLLKVFLVTNKPGWSKQELQKGAGGVPTRELHYTYDEESRKGMVMLYTDHPATEFWKYFVEQPFNHEGAEVTTEPQQELSDVGQAFKSTLVRYLGVQHKTKFAKRRAELARAALLRLEDEYPEVLHQINQARHSTERGEVTQSVIDDVQKIECSGEARDLLGDVVKSLRHEMEFTESITAFSIRDWSRDPFGAAAHSWRPRAKSWEVRGRIKAFGLVGRDPEIKNVHICGEAYSDYQGFIEGALRSAACDTLPEILQDCRTASDYGLTWV
jgi:hypothetical protein